MCSCPPQAYFRTVTKYEFTQIPYSETGSNELTLNLCIPLWKKVHIKGFWISGTSLIVFTVNSQLIQIIFKFGSFVAIWIIFFMKIKFLLYEGLVISKLNQEETDKFKNSRFYGLILRKFGKNILENKKLQIRSIQS